tara:strand:+ start:2213 stop:2731 length:519 start_codon:yes stop_codon:yes gene_type:complete
MENICNICYENLKENNICITPCGHKFCFNCIITSLTYNKKCPCCRKLLKKNISSENNIINMNNIFNVNSDIILGRVDASNNYHLPVNIETRFDFYQTMVETNLTFPDDIFYFNHTLLKLIYGNKINLDEDVSYIDDDYNAYESLADYTVETLKRISFIFKRTQKIKKMLQER